jgi:hypothetical protein
MSITKKSRLGNSDSSTPHDVNNLGVGNIIPNWWYKEIRAAGNKADLVAITILSELYFLHRKTNGGEFNDGYPYFERKFDFTRSQLKDAIIRLADADLVDRTFRTVVINGRNFPNELHLKINIPKLLQLKSKYVSSKAGAGSDNGSGDGSSSNNSEDEFFSPRVCGNTVSYYVETSSEHISNRKTSLIQNRSNESSFFKNSFKGLAQEELNLASFYPLVQSDIALLQKKSNTKFAEVAINEILLKLSKQYSSHKFPNKRAFISYMTKVLRCEMRDAVKISGLDFKLNCNRDGKEYEQEAFLAQIENCRDTSKLAQLKRKLAAVLDSRLAYNLLQAMSSKVELVNNNFTLNVTKPIELSAYQRDIILLQVQAVYGNGVKDVSINAFDSPFLGAENSSVKSPQNNQIVKYSDSALLVGTQSSTIWSKVRLRLIDYFGVNGHDLDRAWFSKVEANIDNDSKTLNLKAPSSFVKDWITERYSHLLERFCYQEQYSLVFV